VGNQQSTVQATVQTYLRMLSKIAVASALVAAAFADSPVHPHPAPAPYHPPPPAPYKPAPHYKPEAKLPPQPFAYQYGVKDDYSGASFDKSETQDTYGKVDGSYRVNLPDGRVQIVTYHADHENGFVADVKYEGEAIYPPEPKEGYGHAAPYHAPKPKYVPAPPPPKYTPA